MLLHTDDEYFKRLFSRTVHWDLSQLTVYLTLFIIMLVSTIRRFYNLDTNSLWSDELWGVFACEKGSWWAMIENLIQTDSHPPGYQTLLYWWMQIFGNSDFSIRAPSAIAGLLAIAWTFELGRRHFSAITGLIAAAFLAGSYQAIYYSQEARAYAFLMCFTPACVSYYLDLFNTPSLEKKMPALWGFWAMATALLYFHYVGAVLLASMGFIRIIGFFLKGHKHNDALLTVCAFSIPLLLYLPWLPVMYQHLVDAPAIWATPMPSLQRVIDTYRFLLGPDNTRFYICLFSLATLILIRFSTWFQCNKTNIVSESEPAKTAAWWMLLLLCILPVLIFMIQAHFGPSAYTFRHFTYAIPLFAVTIACLAAFLAQLMSSTLWRTAYILASCIFASTLNTYYNIEGDLYDEKWKEDYRGAVNIAEQDKHFIKIGEKKIIVTNSPYFDHYLVDGYFGTHAFFYLEKPEQLLALDALLKSSQATVFYYLSVSTERINPLMAALDARYQANCFTRLNNMQTGQFTTTPALAIRPALTDLHDCPMKRTVRTYPKLQD